MKAKSGIRKFQQAKEFNKTATGALEFVKVVTTFDL
jgi:hypothetical protein